MAEAAGEVESEDGVLVIKRIKVTYRLQIEPDADRERVQRAFETHPPKCPVYRSIHPQIDVTTALEVREM